MSGEKIRIRRPIETKVVDWKPARMYFQYKDFRPDIDNPEIAFEKIPDPEDLIEYVIVTVKGKSENGFSNH